MTQMEKEKLEFKNELETQYASGWEKAQGEQSSLRCSIILKGLNTSLQDWLIRGKNERRVAREIEAFLKQNILANENAAERWRNRYNEEIKAYESKNNKLRSDIKMKQNKLEMLEDKVCMFLTYNYFLIEITGVIPERWLLQGRKGYDPASRSLVIPSIRCSLAGSYSFGFGFLLTVLVGWFPGFRAATATSGCSTRPEITRRNRLNAHFGG
ncbi:hypothetical protein G9C98_004397 [Cotesia typhae]|uniref:Uncharacterized protein n=1 Tax=Cotesia typhae TaxID=2053667 RepID=A0A8J5QY94_9HYME|nr:hypothetical protein G9C98_004397 [Cotesia typhae]